MAFYSIIWIPLKLVFYIISYYIKIDNIYNDIIFIAVKVIDETLYLKEKWYLFYGLITY